MSQKKQDPNCRELEVDIRWQGTADIPAFHSTVTHVIPQRHVTSSQLKSAVVETLERGIEESKVEKERLASIALLSANTGLDITKMLEFYEAPDLPSLIIEMDKHVKQLIPQVPEKHQGPVRTPREG